MIHPLKRIGMRLLVGLIATPTSLILALSSAAVAHGQEPTVEALAATDVVINEVVPNSLTEYVEIYNNGTSDVSLTGWTLTDASGTAIGSALSGTLGTGASAYLTRTTTGLLADLGDSVTLKNGAGTVIDSIEYGVALSATVPAPAADKNVQRVSDGSSTWIANQTASRGVSDVGSVNITPTVPPPVPSAASITAGTSNAAGIVNTSSVGATQVSVTIPTTLDSISKVAALVFDSAITPLETTKTGTGLSGTVATDAISVTTLSDGPLTLRTYLEDSSTLRSAWFTGTVGAKDTVAPSTPVITTPSVPANQHASAVTITGTTEAGSSVTVYASDGVTALQSATVTGTTYTATVPLTANATNTFFVGAKDASGNSSALGTVPTIVEDSTAPAVVTGLAAAASSLGTVTLTWTPSTSADTAAYRIYTDSATGTVSFTTILASVSHPTATVTTNVLVNGTHQFVVRAIDGNGNETTNVDAVSVAVSGPKVQASAAPGATADLVGASSLSFTPASTTTGSSTFTVTNLGSSLPIGSVPSGIAFLGQYFEITDSLTPSVTAPVLIKYFYTQSQLTAAGISESQLQGIYSFDSPTKTWQLYGSTGVNTADIVVGGVSYAGFVYANADHFTPLAFGADSTAPSKPGSFTATAGDNQVELSWERLADAVGYTVRYRPATSVDTVSYTTLFLSGSALTSTTVKNLTNGTLYEFGVAAVDAVNNQSQFAVVVARPNESGRSTAINPTSSGTTSTSSLHLATTARSVSVNEEQTPEQTASVSESVTPIRETLPSPTDASGEVKASRDSTESDTNRSRLVVTLLILVIAAGAGAAGYFGYQWWTDRPVPASEPTAPTTPTTETPRPKRKHDRGGRW